MCDVPAGGEAAQGTVWYEVGWGGLWLVRTVWRDRSVIPYCMCRIIILMPKHDGNWESARVCICACVCVENYIVATDKLADSVYKWEGWVRTSRSQAKEMRFMFRVSVSISINRDNLCYNNSACTACECTTICIFKSCC